MDDEELVFFVVRFCFERKGNMKKLAGLFILLLAAIVITACYNQNIDVDYEFSRLFGYKDVPSTIEAEPTTLNFFSLEDKSHISGLTNITWSTNNTQVISQTGLVTTPLVDTAVVITLSATINDTTRSIQTPTQVLGNGQLVVDELLDSITLRNTAVNDIDLPLSIEGSDIFLEWTSSHPEVISITGVVNRQTTDTAVELTVVGNLLHFEATRTFRVTVLALDENHDDANALLDAILDHEKDLIIKLILERVTTCSDTIKMQEILKSASNDLISLFVDLLHDDFLIEFSEVLADTDAVVRFYEEILYVFNFAHLLYEVEAMLQINTDDLDMQEFRIMRDTFNKVVTDSSRLIQLRQVMIDDFIKQLDLIYENHYQNQGWWILNNIADQLMRTQDADQFTQIIMDNQDILDLANFNQFSQLEVMGRVYSMRGFNFLFNEQSHKFVDILHFQASESLVRELLDLLDQAILIEYTILNIRLDANTLHQNGIILATTTFADIDPLLTRIQALRKIALFDHRFNLVNNIVENLLLQLNNQEAGIQINFADLSSVGQGYLNTNFNARDMISGQMLSFNRLHAQQVSQGPNQDVAGMQIGIRSQNNFNNTYVGTNFVVHQLSRIQFNLGAWANDLTNLNWLSGIYVQRSVDGINWDQGINVIDQMINTGTNGVNRIIVNFNDVGNYYVRIYFVSIDGLSGTQQLRLSIGQLLMVASLEDPQQQQQLANAVSQIVTAVINDNVATVIDLLKTHQALMIDDETIFIALNQASLDILVESIYNVLKNHHMTLADQLIDQTASSVMVDVFVSFVNQLIALLNDYQTIHFEILDIYQDLTLINNQIELNNLNQRFQNIEEANFDNILFNDFRHYYLTAILITSQDRLDHINETVNFTGLVQVHYFDFTQGMTSTSPTTYVTTPTNVTVNDLVTNTQMILIRLAVNLSGRPELPSGLTMSLTGARREAHISSAFRVEHIEQMDLSFYIWGGPSGGDMQRLDNLDSIHIQVRSNSNDDWQSIANITEQFKALATADTLTTLQVQFTRQTDVYIRVIQYINPNVAANTTTQLRTVFTNIVVWA